MRNGRIYEAYQTGRGKVTVRARAEVDDEKRRIIVTEIPYGVKKQSCGKYCRLRKG